MKNVTRPANFKWRQTAPELILCAVRWYLRYSLSLRDVEELFAERGLEVDHTTIWRWVQRYGPELEQRLRRHLKPTNKSWRVDETYIRVQGRWCYLYRAIDSTGATIVFTPRIIGFGVAAVNLDGPLVCRMFNSAIAGQTTPKYLSSDNDPLFRFHRWLANLRILEIHETKAIPCTPRSHAFVERLIGTLRREYLGRTSFWNRSDLERKLDDYKTYYNQYRCHTGLAGATPAQRSGAPPHPIVKVESYSWQRHCHGLFETPIAA